MVILQQKETLQRKIFQVSRYYWEKYFTVPQTPPHSRIPSGVVRRLNSDHELLVDVRSELASSQV